MVAVNNGFALVVAFGLGFGFGCESDTRKNPLRDTAVQADQGVEPDGVGADSGPPVDGGDAFVPATCAGFESTGYFEGKAVPFHDALGGKVKTCKDKGDCEATETCFRAPKLPWTCKAVCVPNPQTGGACDGRESFLPNPSDGNQTGGCFVAATCTSVDPGNCPPGTVCAPGIGAAMCTFVGKNDVGDDCLTYTISDVVNGCKFPYFCVPAGAGSDGICRQGCDDHAGGAKQHKCPVGEACTSIIAITGYDYWFCCPEGSNCRKGQ